MSLNRSDRALPNFAMRLRGLLAEASLVLVLCALAVSCFFELRPIVELITIKQDTIVPVPEHGYAVPMPAAPGAPLLSWNGDDYTTHRSRLRMFESGKALPMPHSNQLAVHRQGLGRYAHTGETGLHFSSTDNSDPRSNERTYDIRAEATPRAGLTFGLFVLALSLVVLRLPGLVHSVSKAANARLSMLPACLVFLVVAGIWVAQIWSPKPLILELGDSGNVASIAAGWLYRDWFIRDPVLHDSLHSAFYLALSIPFTMVMKEFTGDIGQAYVLLALPTLLLQMCGFYLLGRRLFDRSGWAVLLALLSVPPVYVFSGELWGNLGMPLTRAVFGALLPFILLASLARNRLGSYRQYVAMFLCGLGVYLHPVSAPTVAFACWVGLVLDRSGSMQPGRHVAHALAAGGLFLIMALPFALSFFSVFPTTHSGESARLAVKALQRAAGAEYFQASDLARSVLTGNWGWRWLVWAAGIGALFVLPRRYPATRRDVRFLAGFCACIVIGSLGLAWIDQALASYLHRPPLQIDLVRNVRFLVPVLLIGTVFWMAMEFKSSPALSRRASGIAAAAVALFLTWNYLHPTPPVLALKASLAGEMPALTINDADREMVRRISRLSRDSVILPLPAMGADSKVEFVGLAVRYAAQRPVAYLGKDLNLLSYTSSPRVSDWMATESDLRRLEDTASPDRASALARIVRRYQVTHLLVHVPSSPSALLSILDEVGVRVAQSGDWQLLAVVSSKLAD